jgi:hypothetical protein
MSTSGHIELGQAPESVQAGDSAGSIRLGTDEDVGDDSESQRTGREFRLRSCLVHARLTCLSYSVVLCGCPRGLFFLDCLLCFSFSFLFYFIFFPLYSAALFNF